MFILGLGRSGPQLNLTRNYRPNLSAVFSSWLLCLGRFTRWYYLSTRVVIDWFIFAIYVWVFHCSKKFWSKTEWVPFCSTVPRDWLLCWKRWGTRPYDGAVWSRGSWLTCDNSVRYWACMLALTSVTLRPPALVVSCSGDVLALTETLNLYEGW